MNKQKNIVRMKFFHERVPLYRNDPVLFANEVLEFEPDLWQKDVMADIAKHPKVSVKSGQGVGKTGVESVILLWFLTCFPYPRIVATAPTRQQLNDVLWSEVAKWQERSPLLKEILKWTKTYIYMRGYEKRWFATARTATKAENMQGFHEDNMLFIVDEASGVADPIMEAILGTLTGENNKLFMCGNPTRTSGTFYDSHTSDRSIYKCHTVSSLDIPRTSKENIQSLIKKYGEDSNVVRVRVKGLFPDQEDDVYMPISLIEQSINTELEGKPINRISLGVDVARLGNDETDIALNIAGDITLPVKFRGQRTTYTVGKIIEQYRYVVEKCPEYRGKIYVNIDDCGVGGGVTDQLMEHVNDRKLKLGRMIVVPVNAAERVPDEEAALHYDDTTTYMWAQVKERMEAGLIRLENDSELVGQFSCRKYTITSKGRIKLESKKEMKKRNIDSPDRADAVALSCYEPKMFSIDSLL